MEIPKECALEIAITSANTGLDAFQRPGKM